ncbi:MAG: hypothetical protein MUF48_21415, partial [Pirellulaceae bacterium]|nr:hypothetical protein [Pirellulaceae bacterium]
LSLANVMRTFGFVSGGLIGYGEGGIPGMIIGALGGAFLLGRLVTKVPFITFESSIGNSAAVAMARETTTRLSAKAQWGPTSLLQHKPSKMLSVVPFPAFMDIFRSARDSNESGDEALDLLSIVIGELVRDASDPYTLEYYQTLAASLKEVRGEQGDPYDPDLV